MSATTNAVCTLTLGDLAVPAGSVVDHILVSCTAANPANSPPSQSLAAAATSCEFDNLAADTYTISAQAFPATGAGFGTAVSVSITITAVSTVTIQVPTSITATQP